MASLITHPVVPIAAAIVLGRRVVPPSVLLLGILLSICPDADSIGFRFGIPYSSPFGHRGFTHSLTFALLIASIVFMFVRKSTTAPVAVFLFLLIATVSHGALDAFTNRGNGVAFFWPFNDARYFFPFHPVETSPVSVQRFFSEHGLEILRSEARWIWTPLFLVTVVGYFVRTQSRPRAKINDSHAANSSKQR